MQGSSLPKADVAGEGVSTQPLSESNVWFVCLFFLGTLREEGNAHYLKITPSDYHLASSTALACRPAGCQGWRLVLL